MHWVVYIYVILIDELLIEKEIAVWKRNFCRSWSTDEKLILKFGCGKFPIAWSVCNPILLAPYNRTQSCL